MAASEKEVKIRISGKVDNSLNAASQKVDKAFSKMTKLAKSATLVGGAAAAAALTGAVEAGSSFESQMSTVEAISGATEKQITQLEEKAKEMGATTKFTATESGQAMEYMAMAGWKTKDMLNGIGGIMDLAAASGEDLAGTSDIVTDALSAFKMEAKESAHFSDVLAAASSNSNTNVGILGESFKEVAPVAGSMKYSIEDVSLTLGLMANQSVKGSKAGTSLKTAIANMAAPTQKMQKAMKKYNISLKDSDGKTKSLRSVIDDVRDSIGGLSSKTERAAAISTIFGKEAMPAMSAIVNASEKDYKKLAGSIDNASGAAKRMAKIRLDNLQGDVTIFQSALEGKGIELYDELKEPMRDIVQSATDWLEEIDVARVVDDFKDFGSAVLDFAEPFLQVGEWMIKNPDAIAGPLAGIGGAITSGKILTILPKVTKGIGEFAKILTAHPWVAGGMLAVSALTGIGVAATKAQKMAADASLDRHFGDIALSMDQIQDAADNIIGSKRLEAVSELLSSMKVSDSLLKDIDKAAKNIKKVDWKLSVGLNLSEDDMTEYEKNVKEYISTAQNLIEEKGYSVTVATNVLFEDGSVASGIIEDNNNFYKKMDEEAGRLSKKINKKLKKAMKDGLTVDLKEEIDGLLSQLSEITNAMTEAENEASWEMLETEFSGKDLDADSFERLQKKVDENIEKTNEGAKSAYQEMLTCINGQRNMGEITDAEHEEKRKEYEKAYYETQADALNQGSEFIYNTLMDAYGEDIANGTMSSSDWNALNSLVSSSGIPEKMQELSEQAKANGYDLSGELAEYPALLEEITKASSGYDWRDMAMDSLTGTDPKETKEHNAADQKLEKRAQDWIHEENALDILFKGRNLDFSGAFKELQKQNEIPMAGKKAGEVFEQYFKNAVKSGLSTGVTANLPLTINPSVNGAVVGIKGDKKGKEKNLTHIFPLPGYAQGTISTKAHIAAVSEGNKTEAIIPIDGSARSRRLYETTGKLMGYNKNPAQGMTFAPTINITLTGKATSEDKNEIRNLVQKELEKQYKKMVRDNKRFNMRQ